MFHSKLARNLTLKMIGPLTEEAARNLFLRLRWPATNGLPVCDACGSTEASWLSSRRIWDCRECGRQFSPTSGTPLQGRKMAFKKYLEAIVLLRDRSQSIRKSATALHVNYRTALRLSHYLRDECDAPPDANECGYCHAPCAGPIRLDGRSRTAGPILRDSLVPKRDDGTIALCRSCQRAAVDAGGLLQMLTKDLELAVRNADYQQYAGKRRARVTGLAERAG
jgi:transposase-like protein